jgi:hypothetical protein
LFERRRNGAVDLFNRCPAVATLPHGGGRCGQRMCAMLLDVVDDELVIQLFDLQAARSRPGKRGIHMTATSGLTYDGG